MRALLVEPHGTTRALLKAALSESGCTEVDVAATVTSASQLLAERPPQVVVAALASRDGSALELLETLRTTPDERAGTPFIVLAQERQTQVILSTADLGPDAVLLQPVSSTQLEERLRTILTRHQVLAPLWRHWAEPEMAEVRRINQKIAEKAPRFRLAAARLTGQILERAGEWQAALDHYETLLAERSRPWALHGKARVLIALEELAEAKTLLDKVTAAHPNYLDAWETLARVAELLANRDEMAQAYRKIVTSAPLNRLRLHTALPELLATGEHETALTVARQLLYHRTARHPEDRLLLCEIFAETGRWEEAKQTLAALAKGKKTASEQAILHFAHFRLAHRQGLTEEATDALRLALHHALDAEIPDPPPAWLNRLVLAGLSESQQRSDALLLLQRLRENIRDHRYRQQLAAQLKNSGKAELMEQIEAALLDRAKALVLEGVAFAQRNDWVATIDAMKQAVATLPGSGAVHFNLALAYLRAAEHGAIAKEEALAAAKRAARALRRLDPRHPGLAKLETLLHHA